jgi:SAM-dependent methyltransferase
MTRSTERQKMARSNPGEFFDKWPVYDQVLDHNYMFHDEMFKDVRRLLAERYERRPFAVLDLGCGGARHLGQALRGRSVSRYVGYDLSDAALARAKNNLTGLGCAVKLFQGDLLEGVRAGDERFDVVFSSFALHHLTSGDQALFFRTASERLNEDGVLLLIDVAREENEDRRVYLDRYLGWLRSEWKALSTEGLEALCDHIRNNDFPQTSAELCTMAADAGFTHRQEVNRFRWHHTWRFEKGHPATR